MSFHTHILPLLTLLYNNSLLTLSSFSPSSQPRQPPPPLRQHQRKPHLRKIWDICSCENHQR
ncbi:hypothetical protein HanRHA438_Chr16g0787771 [Helianthus annuus]|nr:hypothetical protein HanRHA438_Chr16g0787771 [Helianthus annuus]